MCVKSERVNESLFFFQNVLFESEKKTMKLDRIERGEKQKRANIYLNIMKLESQSLKKIVLIKLYIFVYFL